MNKITLLLFLFTPYFSYANTLFSSVSKKFEKDEFAYKQFQQLGIAHCLDMKNEKKENFKQEYIFLYNSLSPLARMIKEESFDITFSKLESGNPPLFKQSCTLAYSSKATRKKYNKLIYNKNSYFNENDEILFSKEELEQNMIDYLKKGKINKCRFLDCE